FARRFPGGLQTSSPKLTSAASTYPSLIWRAIRLAFHRHAAANSGKRRLASLPDTTAQLPAARLNRGLAKRHNGPPASRTGLSGAPFCHPKSSVLLPRTNSLARQSSVTELPTGSYVLGASALVAVEHGGPERADLEGVLRSLGDIHPVAGGQLLPLVDDRSAGDEADAAPLIVRVFRDLHTG